MRWSQCWVKMWLKTVSVKTSTNMLIGKLLRTGIWFLDSASIPTQFSSIRFRIFCLSSNIQSFNMSFELLVPAQKPPCVITALCSRFNHLSHFTLCVITALCSRFNHLSHFTLCVITALCSRFNHLSHFTLCVITALCSRFNHLSHFTLCVITALCSRFNHLSHFTLCVITALCSRFNHLSHFNRV